jgi:hypothetical protein
VRPPPNFQVVHHIICRHRVEVEVCPPRAELYFQDERWIDPIDTQIRFEAIVYNSDRGVTWQVLAPDGGPGQGTIDATGLYRAPDKGPLPSGTTDVVVATARADPLRKAFAWVTVIGRGPLPASVPRIEIWPKVVTLYYQQGADNAFIDDQNKLRVLRAFSHNAAGVAVNWSATGGTITVVGPDSSFASYVAPLTGSDAEQTVIASLAGSPAVAAYAKIILLNYNWPGL